MSVTVRPYLPTDAEPAARLFYDTVRHATAEAYDVRQRAAWAADVPETDVWHGRLAAARTFVAVDHAGALAGFMNVTEEGFVDLAYVRHDLVGQGVGARLHAAVEAAARDAGCDTLTTEASDIARPFFERLGWHHVAPQQVERAGVTLRNHRMKKALL